MFGSGKLMQVMNNLLSNAAKFSLLREIVCIWAELGPVCRIAGRGSRRRFGPALSKRWTLCLHRISRVLPYHLHPGGGQKAGAPFWAN